MNIQTFRAKTMREALDEVRRALGPDAAVLHTRELNTGPLARLLRGRCIEIAARPAAPAPAPVADTAAPAPPSLPPGHDFPLLATAEEELSTDFRNRVSERLETLHSMVEALCERETAEPAPPEPGDAEPSPGPLPDALFTEFTSLLEADVEQSVARDLIERARGDLPQSALDEPILVREYLAGAVRDGLATSGAIQAASGARRVVALVGPTGVGKTTSVAKIAANFRIRDRRSVGLITVDTYRVAAVDQLRTYAEIIDLPMEVVATPREMRGAVERLSDCDVVLIDTAGRSPNDEVRLQELRAMLGEAAPDEVHLVLSATTTRRGLTQTLRRFEPVGVTSVLLTKLDEATTLGHLIGAVGGGPEGAPPVSYVADGQDVPDDIRVAQSEDLARELLRTESR